GTLSRRRTREAVRRTARTLAGGAILFPGTDVSMSTAKPLTTSGTPLILSLVVFSFISFTSIGIPLAALPGYIHDHLGFSTMVAGVVIGIQYLATLLCRPLSGRLTDEWGAKTTLVVGMLSCAASGILLMV